MGSKSDWETMREATNILDELKVPYHVEVVSAHRTPDKLFSFAETAQQNGYKVIIAGAGGAAHLPGMIAAKTLLPVLGVPIKRGGQSLFYRANAERNSGRHISNRTGRSSKRWITCRANFSNVG